MIVIQHLLFSFIKRPLIGIHRMAISIGDIIQSTTQKPASFVYVEASCAPSSLGGASSFIFIQQNLFTHGRSFQKVNPIRSGTRWKSMGQMSEDRAAPPFRCPLPPCSSLHRRMERCPLYALSDSWPLPVVFSPSMLPSQC